MMNISGDKKVSAANQNNGNGGALDKSEISLDLNQVDCMYDEIKR